MSAFAQIAHDLFASNGLLTAFALVGLVTFIGQLMSKYVTRGVIHTSAIAIIMGLILAYIGGAVSGGTKGLSDIPLFAGVGFLGNAMFRDFTIVSSAYGASFKELRRSGLAGIISLIIGVLLSFFLGVWAAWLFGYRSAAELATLGGGAVTFVVGPVTGAALGVSSDVIALSIAIGVVKSFAVMTLTPFMAKLIGIKTPKTAMILGGLVGSTSGTSAGLATVNPALVPYGAMTATFYSGLGCLICPSVLYGLLTLLIQ